VCLIAILLSQAKQHNAAHHPPSQAIDLLEKQRVGGRVHAVVMLRVNRTNLDDYGKHFL
jgi:hypothetical protein